MATKKEEEKTVELKLGESIVDLSDYSEFCTPVKTVFAKRLTEKKEYKVVVNGIQQTLYGHPGNLDVFETKADGGLLRNMPYEQALFDRRFTEKDTQGDLDFENKQE